MELASVLGPVGMTTSTRCGPVVRRDSTDASAGVEVLRETEDATRCGPVVRRDSIDAFAGVEVLRETEDATRGGG
jgi:hypothetical protein